MDTGSTLYKRLQASLERQKKAKRKEAAKKCKKTKTENQRKRNEAAGLGYHTDNEVKAYEKCSKRMKKRKKEIIDAWNKKQKQMAAKRRREKERLKREELKKKEKEKEKKLKQKRREQKKRKERNRRKQSRRMKKHNIWRPKTFIVYLAQNGQSYRHKNKIGSYFTLDEARDKVKSLMEEEKNVIFERLNKTYEDGTMESNYEYVIYKDLRGGEAKPSYLKNEFGKYVEHTVENGNKSYEILEKYKARIEDTVWVYGYDWNTDRKTFAWVYDNVLNEGFSSSYDMKRIYLYHNKVVFCNDRNEIDIVICKTASDASRFYAILQKYCKKGPYLFMGVVTTKSALCEPLEKLLVGKTGWSIETLRRNQNRF